jgi:hypothetical protein
MTKPLLPSETATLIRARCSHDLLSAMAARESLGASFRVRPPALPKLLESIQGVRPTIDAAMAPASFSEVSRWVTVILDQTKHRMTVDEIERRVTMCAKVLASQPACAFTETTLIRVLRICKFAPVPAELYEMVWPMVEPLVDLKNAIDQIEALCVSASATIGYDGAARSSGEIVRFVDQADQPTRFTGTIGTES